MIDSGLLLCCASIHFPMDTPDLDFNKIKRSQMPYQTLLWAFRLAFWAKWNALDFNKVELGQVAREKFKVQKVGRNLAYFSFLKQFTLFSFGVIFSKVSLQHCSSCVPVDLVATKSPSVVDPSSGKYLPPITDPVFFHSPSARE
jgi:hypothetical protein